MSCLRITLKFLQLIACISALIFKKLTDKHAMRVFLLNQKFSREWRLLNNLTWSAEGHDYSILTYGGYTFITAVLLLSNLIDRESKRHVSERIFLICGMVFFSIQGLLVFTSLEYIPRELEINAYVLGSLTILIAFLLLIDLFYTPRNDFGFEKKYQITKQLSYKSPDLTTDQYTIKRPKLITKAEKKPTVEPSLSSEHEHEHEIIPDELDADQTQITKSGKFLCEDIEKRKKWIDGKLHTLTGRNNRPLTSDGYYYKHKYNNNTDV